MGKADKVTGMTFSEFGRRIKSNASVGTDHGTAAPVLFFGAAVQPGITGRLAKPCRKRHGQRPGSHAARFPAIVCCGDAGLAVLNSSGIANGFREFLYQAAGFWKRCIAT